MFPASGNDKKLWSLNSLALFFRQAIEKYQQPPHITDEPILIDSVFFAGAIETRGDPLQELNFAFFQYLDSSRANQFAGKVVLSVSTLISILSFCDCDMPPTPPVFECPKSNPNSIIQWDHYRILRSGQLGPGYCNGGNSVLFAKSGPFPDHFLNFSGPLVVLPV